MNTGWLKEGMHQITYRVYYEDTDAAGIVYYANYLKFAERARTDALRLLGIQQSTLLHEEGLGFVVTAAQLRFKSSAKLDDIIRVETTLKALGKVRLTMEQTLYREQTTLTEILVDIAMLDRNHAPTRIPPTIVEALSSMNTG